MHLLWECIIGLIVGAVAKFLMPGKDPGGIWITMIIGIAGSIIATYLGQAIRLVSDRSGSRVHHVSRRRHPPTPPLPRNPRRRRKSLTLYFASLALHDICRARLNSLA
jgi:uncharacterized membrane protein YeaQ/YmgE (transglycosylase-associated protein family)